MFRPVLFLAICRLDTNIGENYTIHNMVQYKPSVLVSIIHNMLTTCFGQYYFWLTSVWIQLSEKTTQYII